MTLRNRTVSNVSYNESLARKILNGMPTVFRLKFHESANMKKMFSNGELFGNSR